MLKFRWSTLNTIILTAIFSQAAFAGGYQLYEVGAPSVGTAEVGQAVVADDASIAYYNPAGMIQLKQSQFLLGTQVLLPYMNFSRGNLTTISGDNGGSAGNLVPGMGMFFVYSYRPCLKFGVSLTSPYGGALSYNDGWIGRYNVQDAMFYTFNLNPSVAFNINKWVDVGVGVVAEYMNLQQTTALPPFAGNGDGQVNVKVSDLAYGYNLGVTLSPSDSTKIGIAYRSQIVHGMHGNITFLRINSMPSVTTKSVDPQGVIVSFSQRMFNRLNLLAEVGWSNWSKMKNTALHVRDLTATTPLDWHDTYRVGLGGQFQLTPAFMLQAGASLDSSPTNTSHRLPVLPMDRQIRLGTGFTYAIIQPVTLGVSYEYVNFGKANIQNTTSNGVLQGSYWRNFGNFFQLSLNILV